MSNLMTEGRDASELVFIPLGGTGEIGMNLNLYGLDGKWIMVDCGITFAEAALPGIDILMPDPAFIEERASDLLAIVLTHAHEDHLGAVHHLWKRFRCPVYATPFTAAMLRTKLDEAGLLAQVPLHEVAYGESIKLGPFDVTYIGITHSIPEGSALAIRTPGGTILHTGDWKLDDEPQVGQATDEAAFRAIGDEGVLAMVCDSTNVFNAHASGSEASVRKSLMELVKGWEGRVAVTTFASNVARIATVAAVAKAHGRELAVIGRSLWRAIEAAQSVGYLPELQTLLTADEAAYLPRDKTMLICTGCQGEPRGAMARIAAHDHPNISLESGDLVIFSSKIIPGNEAPIDRMCNNLLADGIELMTEQDHHVHVSGHPGKAELAELYDWLKPAVSIPVHGETRHLLEHATFAESIGIKSAIRAQNGSVVRLSPGPVEIVDHVPTGRLALDGETLVGLDSDSIRTRRRLMHNGLIGITIILEPNGDLVTEPRVHAHGIDWEQDTTADERVEQTLAAALEELSDKAIRDDRSVEQQVRRTINRIVRPATGKKPLVNVDIIRLTGVYENAGDVGIGGGGR
jgi:ribonuclease J